MVAMDNEVLWNETLKQLRAALGETEFNDWFTDIRFVKSGGDSLTIGFPSAFHRDRVKKSYLDRIAAKLREIASREITVEFEVITKKGTERPPHPKNPPIRLRSKPKRGP
jgi:chromosomal replication initiation ATPase DnaA